MSSHKRFKHESQDARRHDEQHAAHPEELLNHTHDKLTQKKSKHRKKK